MCSKCKVYLYDYFQQPLDKENPLYSFVNQNQVQQNLPELVELVSSLLTSKSLSFHTFADARSQLENYCRFVKKPDSIYQEYELLYSLLSQNKKVVQELNAIEGSLLDLKFLKLEKTDAKTQIVHRWFAFLLGSLYEDMFILHRQHLGDTIWPICLDKGLPGRPDTAPKQVRRQSGILVKLVDEDDLYT